eukprot:TRINITY_DN3483_c0_g1_i1.p1 TRINITY_DN3483_c0_g1~~TRINITY_DN3483_c0_g1_i1.p1  ORF type:complete len:244 (-),score=3.62 TRINITY_DN3483_c0_g1_i1:444-1175(-)
MKFSILLALVLAHSCEGATSYFYFGDKLLLSDEGESVQSPSGYRSVIDIDSSQCAEGCLSLKQQCDCCDSFTYNTFRRECFYKKRSSDSASTTFNDDGWQSYTFDRFLQGVQFIGSVDSLQSQLTDASNAYVHYGFNKVATDEGFSLPTFDGKEYLSRVTPNDCAKECNRVPGCNSFSFNPNLDGDGRCYMKQVTVSERTTTYSADGWRTYWKDFDPANACFCTCQNTNYCVICQTDSYCFER